MRIIKIFLLSFLVITSISCRKKVKSKEVNKKPIYFQIQINAKVLEDDVFEVYYFENGQDGFLANQFVESNVVGTNEFQNILFDLPIEIYPERIRLDFGKNIKQKKIELNYIKINFKDKTYEFTQEQLKNKLAPSKFINFDRENLILEPKVIDQRYDPYLYSFNINGIIDFLLED